MQHARKTAKAIVISSFRFLIVSIGHKSFSLLGIIGNSLIVQFDQYQLFYKGTLYQGQNHPLSDKKFQLSVIFIQKTYNIV